jgi:signal transduction histidine kinase
MAILNQNDSKKMDEIFKITSIISKNSENTLSEILKVACAALGTEIGIISNIKDDVYVVYEFYAVDDSTNFKEELFKTQDTYCDIAIKENKVVAINDFTTSEYKNHPCFDIFKLQSYIGVPIKFNEYEVGTLSFSSSGTKTPSFSQSDKDLVQYLGQWVSNFLDRLYYKQNISIKNNQLEEVNKELAANNENLQKIMQEKNQLHQILVHDLKSPLSNIKMLSFLFQDFVKDKESEELLGIFNNSLKDVFHLISQMETLNSVENFELNNYIEEFDINEFLLDNLKNFYNTADIKEIKIEYLVEGKQFIIKTDQNFLKRILHNLLSNAIKFSAFRKNIYVKLKQINNQFEISVKDEGPGIKQDEKAKLFDRFSKLSNKPTNNESSSGLGLFIVKELVNSLAGEIHVISVLEEGSTFKVILPQEIKNNS